MIDCAGVLFMSQQVAEELLLCCHAAGRCRSLDMMSLSSCRWETKGCLAFPELRVWRPCTAMIRQCDAVKLQLSPAGR